MRTFHVAKFNCYSSSRVMMQSRWDNKSFFIQSNKYPGYENIIFLNYRNVLMIANSLGPKDNIIFHSQSSLPFLIFVILFSKTNTKQLLYDIHDLNVIKNEWNYSKIRGFIMHALEYFVLKIMRVQSMIVSKGLAIIVQRRFKVKRPLVVRNISAKFPKNLPLRISTLNRGVYFGTFDRLDDSFFEKLYQGNHRIDIYGRFNHGKPSKIMTNAINDGLVNNCGEYYPEKMNFLNNYDFLYYNIRPYDINYRFAAPNKFFQALAYGLVLLTPPGYSELACVLNKQPGLHFILQNNLSESLHQHSIRNLKTIKNVENLLRKLLKESEKNYKFLLKKI